MKPINTYLPVISIMLIIVFVACQNVAFQNNERERLATKEINQPLPSYLSYVAPEPETVHSVEEFNAGAHYYSIKGVYPGPPGDGRNRVCIELVATTLLEPGDYYDYSSRQGDFLPDQVTLYIDNRKAERDEEVISILDIVFLRDENNEIVGSAVGPQIMCWPVTLEPDIHFATIEVEKSSGMVEIYSWSFELTE